MSNDARHPHFAHGRAWNRGMDPIARAIVIVRQRWHIAGCLLELRRA